MRRLLALPPLLVFAAIVVLLGGLPFGRTADRYAMQLARWAQRPQFRHA